MTGIQLGAYPIVQYPKHHESDKRLSRSDKQGFYMPAFFLLLRLFYEFISSNGLGLEP